MKISSYKDLEVWQVSVGMASEIYDITRSFPKEEIYSLTSQIRRAAISIPANIAEGWGRNMTKEYIQFLRVARGSLSELETRLIISNNLSYMDSDSLDALSNTIRRLSSMLNSMIDSLSRKLKS